MKILKNLDGESRMEALTLLLIFYAIAVIYCCSSPEKYLEGTILPGNTFNWVCIIGWIIFSIINYLCINWSEKAKPISEVIVTAVSSIFLSGFLTPVCLACVLKLNSISFNHETIVKIYKINKKHVHIRSGRGDVLPEYSCYSMFDLETGQAVSLYLLPKREFEQHENYIAINCYKGLWGWYKLEKPFITYKLDIAPLNKNSEK